MDIMDIPDRGIYAFIDEERKVIFIRYGLYKMVYKILKEKYMLHSIKEFQESSSISCILIQNLPETCDELHTRLHVSCYEKEYREKGYTVAKPIRVSPMIVRLKIGVKNRVYVELKSRTNDVIRYVVGVFDNIPEANEFMKTYYDNSCIYREQSKRLGTWTSVHGNSMSFFVYANNNLTRKFVQARVERAKAGYNILEDVYNKLKE